MATRSAVTVSLAGLTRYTATCVGECEYSGGPGTFRRLIRPAALRCQAVAQGRSEEHTSELQSPYDLVCRFLLEKTKSAAFITAPASWLSSLTMPRRSGGPSASGTRIPSRRQRSADAVVGLPHFPWDRATWFVVF